MPINILMPALSPTMEEGALARWNVRPGDSVKAGDVIAEIETDKATMEVEAVDEGVVDALLVAEGTQGVKVNTIIAVLRGEGEPAGTLSPALAAPAPASLAAQAPAPAAPAAAAHARPSGARVFASPLARRIAREKGLELSAIRGSGPHGRIVRSDVESAGAAPSAISAPATVAVTPAAAPAVERPGSAPVEAVRRLYADRKHEEIALDGMRRTIAARLTEAKQTIPHFYLRRDIRLDALLALRADLNARVAAQGVKLSVNDFIIKASALALQRAPQCNAVWAGDRVLQFRASDVGVAVAVEGGLFVPIIRDAEAKSLSAISAEMRDLAKRARDRKLAPHEYQGGSFAISNLGMFGIDSFDAVINPPHASILAVGAGVEKALVVDGSITVATTMAVTLSVDHRVIDGALGAKFLESFRVLIEEPMAMLV